MQTAQATRVGSEREVAVHAASTTTSIRRIFGGGRRCRRVISHIPRCILLNIAKGRMPMVINIELNTDEEQLLRQEADRHGRDISDYARQLIEDHLRTPVKTVSGCAWDVLEGLVGTIVGPTDWASEHDHYLSGAPKAGNQ